MRPIEYRQVRDVGQCIAAATHVIQHHGRVIWRTLLLTCVPSAALAMLIVVAFSHAQDAGEYRSLFDLPSTGPLLLVIVPLLLFSFVMLDAITFEAVRILSTGSGVLRSQELFGAAIQRFWHYLALVVPFLVVLAVERVVENVYWTFGRFVSMPLVTFLSVNFALAPAVCAVERKGVGGSWARGFRLVKERWWKSWWLVVVATFIWTIFGSMIVLPLNWAYYLISEFFGLQFLSWREFTSLLLPFSTGVFYALFPFVRLVQCFWYFTLTEQQESTGLADRVARLDHL